MKSFIYLNCTNTAGSCLLFSQFNILVLSRSLKEFSGVVCSDEAEENEITPTCKVYIRNGAKGKALVS